MRLRLAVAVLAVLFAKGAGAAEANPHNTLDCLYCHSEVPRWGIDTKETVEEAGFYRYEGDDPRLCFSCHEAEENLHPLKVEPGTGNLGTVRPDLLPLGSSEEMSNRVVCTTCHFVHASNTAFALLRGFPGSQRPGIFRTRWEFCGQCHGDQLKRRSPHAGDERACTFCHTAQPKEGTPVKVADLSVALCSFCHGIAPEGHESGVNPFQGPVDCLTCHDPHLGPESPGRLKPAYYDCLRGAVTVNPHNRETLCSLCHVDSERFALIIRDPVLLCNRCHMSPRVVGDIHPPAEIPEGMSIPEGWPVKEGRLTCLTCHEIGHPEDKGLEKLLRGGPYGGLNEFCGPCHRPGEAGEENPHELVRQLKGCTTCHDTLPVFGRDTAQTVSFVASINLLCLRCHEVQPHPGGTTHIQRLSGKRIESIPYYLPLDRYQRITCATCHNPHLDSSQGLKLRESIEGMSICGSCHGQ